MLNANYVYYALTDLPKYPANKPLGLFRARDGDMLNIEALGHNGCWHESNNALVKVAKGEFDAEVIDLETARIAFKKLGGREC